MKVLALVLAGGKGSRLYPLTAGHAKPALPFANGYRIIDFVLSNLVNSGISSIYLLVQYKPESLPEHLNTAWVKRFDGNANSFLRVVRPKTDGSEMPFRGTADAVYRSRYLIERHNHADASVEHLIRREPRDIALEAGRIVRKDNHGKCFDEDDKKRSEPARMGLQPIRSSRPSQFCNPTNEEAPWHD